MRALNDACPLVWATLMDGLMTAMSQNAGIANPGIFEVDALFPRNETYTPQVVMPIVFAEGNNYSSPGSVVRGAFDLEPMGFASNKTLLITRIVNTIAYPEGYWTLWWNLQINNCSQSDNSTVQPIYVNGSTVFTVSTTGQAPDFLAATSSEACGSADAYAFNATSFGDFCGALGSTPTTNPCSATINPSVVSSIYAAGTAAACVTGQQNPNVTCPTSPANPLPRPLTATPNWSSWQHPYCLQC